EAEKSLLSCLMIDPAALDMALDENLSASDFYLPKHAAIYRSMVALHCKKLLINTVTLLEELANKNDLETIGGVQALTEFENYSLINQTIPFYIQLIKDKSCLRKLMTAASQILQEATHTNTPASEIIDAAEQAILGVRNSISQNSFISIQELSAKALKHMEKLSQNQIDTTGIRSGFIKLDEITSGFQPGELTIIAARPSMGKTAFTLNIAAYISIASKIPVGFFSLEMSAEQLVYRLLGAESGIDLTRMRLGHFHQLEIGILVAASGRIGSSPLFIDETPSLTIADMRHKCRRMVSRHGVQLIIIDYLQLMSSTESYENKATEIGEISKGLKSIARELKVPVIALSQLNRGVESRTDKRPMMSDLRESGAIEQDADVIAFLYREEYYLRDKTPQDKNNVAEVIVAKNRNGPTGMLELRFSSAITKFQNLDRIHTNVS
ncbi:replicative DNA helicase, partial [Candidatus Dependentiae bacterium]|nr:replicative DNA helicase [Candidatus Dependentiae bacterium]